MFRCSLCSEIFTETHHEDRCRDNLYELINDELDNIKCKSILKNILEIIRHKKILSNI
jgi:hypothetical protein